MIVSVWICDTKQCATGEWYPLPSPTFNLREMFSADRIDEIALLDSLAGQTDGCEPCAFLSSGKGVGGTCPAAFTADLCPALETSRLRVSPDLDCYSEVWPYYGVAAMLMILCFSVGVPVVFYELVKQHTDRYASLDVYAVHTGGRHGPSGPTAVPSPGKGSPGKGSPAKAAAEGRESDIGGAGGARRRGSVAAGGKKERRGSAPTEAERKPTPHTLNCQP